MSLERKTRTIHETAAILGVHPDTIRRRVKDGSLSATKVCGRFLIFADSIDAMLEAGRVAA
jgi:excisionase family DNA binding protein